MPQTQVAAAFGLLLLLHQASAEGCSNVSALSQQLDSVLAEYDRESAPANPARVHLAFDLRHATLRSDDTVHLLADLVLSWTDPRISWNASEWGCNSVLASPDRVWLPEVELLNGVGTAQAALSVRVSSDGRLARVVRLDAAVPVALALKDWPVDVQTAVFKFGSRTHNVDELDLEISNILLAVVFEAGAWELRSMTGAVSTAGERSVATWAVRLRRRSAAIRVAASAILAATTLQLLAAVALPARARPPLCACASFTAALWLVSALPRVPSGGSAPAVLCAMCGVCAIAAAAAMAASIVARLAARPDQPPRPLRTLASTLSRWRRLTPSEEECEQAQVGAWVILASLLDRALTASLLLALFICICIFI